MLFSCIDTIVMILRDCCVTVLVPLISSDISELKRFSKKDFLASFKPKLKSAKILDFAS